MSETAVVVGVGASRGLGAALARRFAREGLHMFVSARSAERLAPVVAEIEAAGGRATAVAGDATREADVVRLLDAAEAAGPLAVVCYNAGNNRRAPLLDLSAELFEVTWRVGCLGGMIVGREAARRMLPRGRGSILFTGATASLKARPPFTPFASAKAALRALVFAMARELGPQGLHVGHVIVDGVIDGDVIAELLPELKERLGRDGMLDPDAIAEAFAALHAQHPSAWTLELDLRPFKESF